MTKFKNHVETLDFTGKAYRDKFPGARGAEICVRYQAEFASNPLYRDSEDPNEIWMNATQVAAAVEWVEQGKPRFILSDSLAAVLSLTRAPAFDLSNLPYSSLCIEIPWRFFPLTTGKGLPVVISLSKLDTLGNMGSMEFIFVQALMSGTHLVFRGWHQDLDEEKIKSKGLEWEAVLMNRFAANVLAYITEHKECVRLRRPSRNAPEDRTHDVSVPRDLVVSKQLRDCAASLASARDFRGVKKALQHVVRGHWRNQVHGPGRAQRRLTWIQPFLRGDVSLGRVAERIVLLGSKD